MREKASNLKPQASGKPQPANADNMKPKPANPKPQRNSKSQALNDGIEALKKHGNGEYPSLESAEWILHEAPGDNAAQRHPFDLEERSARFGEAIIQFAKKIPRGPGNDRLIDQLVACGTSVGANYCEANEGCSKRDFTHSISRCSKEAHETKFFLRMAAAAEPQLAEQARTLYREANELHLIFAAIFRKGRAGLK